VQSWPGTIPGIGVAFDRYNLGEHRVIGHEGVLPGFNSQILLAPDDGTGVMAFTNGASGAMFWLPAECSRLLARLLGVQDNGVRSDIPQRPEIWGNISGWYKPYARLTDMRLRTFLGLGAEVFVRGDRLMARFLNPVPALSKGFVLEPDDESDPYVFRVRGSALGIDGARFAFSHGASEPIKVHFELLPISLEKQPAVSNPRLWLTTGLRVVALAGVAVALRRRRNGRRKLERARLR